MVDVGHGDLVSSSSHPHRRLDGVISLVEVGRWWLAVGAHDLRCEGCSARSAEDKRTGNEVKTGWWLPIFDSHGL